MSKLRALALGLCCLMAPSVASAQAGGCDVDYVVQPGDTLRKIAETAYGDPNYQLIFSRNQQAIANPNELTAGQILVIPCIAGEAGGAPDAAALAAAMAETPSGEPVETPAAAPEQDDAPSALAETAPESEAAPAPGAEADPAMEPDPAPAAPGLVVKFLTADGQPPFADRGLRGGGMATELIRAAAAAGGLSDASRIVFVNDRDSHLKDLLAEGSFDIGFPWRRPQCDRPETEADAWFCDAFIFSEPLYETVNGFFTRTGEFTPGNVAFADFADARLCRPAGAALSDLVAQGLPAEAVRRPATLGDCLDALADGQVDAVSGDVFEAEALIAEHGLEDAVEEQPDLALLQTLHAVAPAAKPGAAAAMDALNRGLVELKVSGQWFRIVRRHLPHS